MHVPPPGGARVVKSPGFKGLSMNIFPLRVPVRKALTWTLTLPHKVSGTYIVYSSTSRIIRSQQDSTASLPICDINTLLM